MSTTSTKTTNRPSSNQQNKVTLKTAEDGGEGIWSQLLDSVSRGKRLAEKNVLVLGGNSDSQKLFLDALSQDPAQSRRNFDRPKSHAPTVANRFALGYTYQDVLDADQDDILARLSLYLLANSTPAFSPLLRPLFNAKTVPNTLIVILLDWGEPWKWIRQIRDWIRLLRNVLQDVDTECADALEENMKEWRERRKGPAAENTSNMANPENNVTLPIGPGEWDEALGVPLCVCCQNAEKIEILERERGWKDEEFDFILQYLRTILLKHGASLIYTASSAPGSLQTLVRSSLDVYSLLQKNSLKHNVVDRDKVLVPPNWDSWGKIRVLREGFDVENINDAWSISIQPTSSIRRDSSQVTNEPKVAETEKISENEAEEDDDILKVYAEVVQEPNELWKSGRDLGAEKVQTMEVKCPDNQEFLSEQVKVLELLKQEDDQEKKAKEAKKASSAAVTNGKDAEASKVSEHIGPVQFNMGGIQVDADDMLQSLRDREAGRVSEEATSFASPDGNIENEKLASFFAGLMSRGSNSTSSSPKP